MTCRLFRFALFLPLLIGVAACSRNSEAKFGSGGKTKSAPPTEIGRPLYAEAPWPNYGDGPSLADPIRVPLCHLTVLDKVDVSSKEEGTVAWLGVELRNGDKVGPAELHEHVRGEVKRQYRRLRIGDRVVKGQIIALLDETRAALEHRIAVSTIKSADKEVESAQQGIEIAINNVKIEEKAKTSDQHRLYARAGHVKAIAEKATKEFTAERTRGEEEKAKDRLNNHLIRAPITGEVVLLHKQIGEGVRPTEAVLQIQNTDRLGVEGYLEVQFAKQVAIGSEVFLEPALLDPPLPVHSPHTSPKPIAAVATGTIKGKPVVVSAGEDGSVHVWDLNEVHASWKHAGAVRAVACTRPAVKAARVLTGCDDGKVRIWSLEVVGKTPALTLDAHHEGGVQAAAFSPDGAHCVSADDRGEMFLSDARTGKTVYTFPREHTSTVTSLNFTPQCRIVSVGRDGVALVWKVGDQSAAVEHTLDRSGEVNALGVSDDGAQMLLDLDKNRLRVVGLNGARNLGTFRQAGDGRFAGFAQFSPAIRDAGANRLLLTAGAGDGVLQLWRWTAGAGRGAELRKLVCTGYVPATCAAFSAEAKDGLIVAGTRKGDVHLWPMPTEDDLANRYRARITHVDPNLEASGKTVRIIAEYDNTAKGQPRLRPGTTTTMVIPQASRQ